MKSREARLGEASELQHFLQNLDHFQKWLSDTQTAVASEDSPASMTEAEKLLAQHAQIRDDIDQMNPEYTQLQEFGAKVRLLTTAREYTSTARKYTRLVNHISLWVQYQIYALPHVEKICKINYVSRIYTKRFVR